MAFNQPVTPIPLETVSDSSAQLSQLPSTIENTTAVQSKIPGFLSSSSNPLSLFILFVLISIISPGIHTKQKSRSLNDIFRSIEKTVFDYEIFDMLTAVSPYLDTPEQEAVYSILGVLEAIYILKGVSDGSYQVYRMQQTPVITQHDDKGLGIVKALMNYIPEKNRPAVDKTVQIYESLERLSDKYKTYSNTLDHPDRHKLTPIEQMSEIINIIKPVVPQEQQNRIDKLQKVLQIAQVMDIDEMMKTDSSDLLSDDQDIQGEESRQPDKELDGGDISQPDVDRQNDRNFLPAKQETNGDIQQSSENQSQDQSLEMILKLMKLLSQSSNQLNI